MKIAVLTQPLIENYGGILQNYALQTVLKKRGHEVQTLHITRLLRRKDRMVGKLYDFYVLFRNMLNTILGKKPYLLQTRISADDKKLFLSKITPFVNDRINCTRPVTSIGQLKKHADFEAYIVGSDQVWRPSYSPDIYTYFLEFLQKKSTVKKVAYAASFGTTDWVFPPDMTARCKKSAARFDAISVREVTGIELCKKYLDCSALQVPDPTLLLSAEDYRQLFSNNNLSGKGKLVTYILDNSPEKEKLIQKTAQTMGLAILPLQKEFAPGTVKIAIEDWLSAIADAEYVITDSFHGTVFSIIFNRQFAVFSNQQRGKDRFTTLLNKLNMQKRLISSLEKIPTEKIDYSTMEENLSEYRNVGYNFLQDIGF